MISVSVSVSPHFGDHFAGLGVDDVDARGRGAAGALAALDGVHLVAEIDRRVRREDLDRVDALAAEAVEHLFGQLVAFLARAAPPRRARAAARAFLVLAFGRFRIVPLHRRA